MPDHNITPPWERWPPPLEEWRLAQYALYKTVLLGNHREVFRRAPQHKPTSELSKVVNASYLKGKPNATEPYVVLNYCKKVATTFASKLFGNAPEYRVGGDADLAQQRLQKILIDNTLDNTNIEQAIASVALGDCVYRVRYGKMRNWAEAMPIIEAVPGRNYFAETSPDNIKDVQRARLAFEFTAADGTQYVKLEHHSPGTVVHELWQLTGNTFDKLVPFDTLPDTYGALLQSVQDHDNISMDGSGRILEDTGYPGLLVEYVPNFLLPDEFYGHSDYDNLLTIQDDINQTGSGILQVILKHIDPKLIMPPGTMKYDAKRGTWLIYKEDLEVVEVPKEVGAVLPRFLTWDASLGAAKANMEALFEAFMIIADISLPMLGLTKYGTAESASAIELKMTDTTDAVQRKRRYYDTALKNVLYAAQWLDVHYGGQAYTPQEVSIQWPSPVPMDRVAETDLHAKRYESGLESQREAVKAVQKLDGEALDAELDAIAEDQAAKAPAFLPTIQDVNNIDDE